VTLVCVRLCACGVAARRARNGKALKCAIKASQGLLYPLDREFLFTPKPVVFMRYKDVSAVDFSPCVFVGNGVGPHPPRAAG
jgi:hypothetical protein